MPTDTFDLFVPVLGAASFIPAALFLVFAKTHPGQKMWLLGGIAFLLIVSASVLFSVRGILPDFITIFIANIMVCVGHFLGVRAFRQLKPNIGLRYWEWYVLGISILAILAVYFLDATYEIRVAVISAAISAFSTMMMLIGLQQEQRASLFGDRIIISMALVNTFLAALRGLTALNLMPHSISLAATEQAFLIGSIAYLFALFIGLFLNGNSILVSEMDKMLERKHQLSERLQEQIEGQKNLQKLILHEIKRPLNAASAHVMTVMAEADQVADNTNDMERMGRLIGEMTNYVSSIADYEELRELFDSPNIEPVSISEFLANIKTKYRIPVNLKDSQDGIEMLGDDTLLDIAVGNLIENAAKFGITPSNTELNVRLDEKWVYFDIVDDGDGIQAAEWELVWGQFYRSGDESANAVKGCGLGLYVVREIARAHSGEAKVISQTPSVIRLAIPLVTAG